jgi:hypothetical protein
MNVLCSTFRDIDFSFWISKGSDNINVTTGANNVVNNVVTNETSNEDLDKKATK